MVWSNNPPLYVYKKLSLPNPAIPNSIYYIKNGAGFDIWLTDVHGIPVPLNTSGGGGSGSPPQSHDVVAPTSGGQNVALPSSASAIIGLYINGLRQREDAFTSVGSSVTLPADLNVIAGDIISVEYTP
jgi:hypothetical protein